MSGAGATSAAATPPVSAAAPAEAPSGDAAVPAENRRVSTSDIQLVQNLIERCLQMYMSQKEVTGTLQGQAKIEPGFTGLVWQASLEGMLALPSCADGSVPQSRCFM